MLTFVSSVLIGEIWTRRLNDHDLNSSKWSKQWQFGVISWQTIVKQ